MTDKIRDSIVDNICNALEWIGAATVVGLPAYFAIRYLAWWWLG
jgi:hypothetical protein